MLPQGSNSEEMDDEDDGVEGLEHVHGMQRGEDGDNELEGSGWGFVGARWLLRCHLFGLSCSGLKCSDQDSVR